MSKLPSFFHLLKDKYWRLNNLYTIQDKEGTERLLNLNHAQRNVILKFRHNKKIILKSRQQGISTLYVAYYLDNCIFGGNYQAGIQSYGRSESRKLKQRALLMWNKLPQEIKDYIGIKLVKSNGEELEFSNGSILKVGNFRGDTLQGLHVSELAKISKLFPEKARELKTGAFQAVSVKSKITIETTAEGDSGLFVDIWNRAITVQDTGRTLTPLDFQPIFLPWYNDPDCSIDIDIPIGAEARKYEAELLHETKAELTNPQLAWLEVKLDELGGDFDREYPSTAERAFSVSVDGAYFAKQYRRMYKQERIVEVDYNKSYKVDVSFDLGLNDEMVLLFSQTINGYVVFIDEYHNSGEGIPFYLKLMTSLPYNYNYGDIILPHDANVKDLSTGRTRIDVFRQHGFNNIVLLKRLSFQESIEVGRNLLDSPKTIISTKCVNLLTSLRNYRKKFDKALGVFMERDVHDIHSNYGASLRYKAQAKSTYILKPTILNRPKNINSLSL